MTHSDHSASPDYRVWQRDFVRIGARSYRVASKPGVFAHGRGDPAAVMLANNVVVNPGDHVMQLNCGSGLLGAVAAASGAASVTLADRNVLSYEAARRTLESNDVANGTVLLSHGANALPGGAGADTIAIRIPHERLAQLQLLANAFRLLRVGGACFIAGAVNEGIKPATRALERIFGAVRVLEHGSGHRVVRAIKLGAVPADAEELAHPMLQQDTFQHVDATLRGRALTLHSRPGVFSWEHVDEATTLLADHMIIAAGESVLDLGCGFGALGTVAGLITDGAVCMVDADIEAVRSAGQTARAAGLTRCRVLASDVTAAVHGEQFHVVVSNPPFHIGKATDLTVPKQFIDESWEVLVQGGSLQLVANRTLPYERMMQQRFGNIATVFDGPRFKVLRAVKRRSS